MAGRFGYVRSGERGTSVAEVALILPVFLMLLIGAVDFGMAVVQSNLTAEAARDAARAGQVLVVQGDATLDASEKGQIRQAGNRVMGSLGARVSIPDGNITVVPDANGYLYVRVLATSTYSPVAGRFLGRIGAKTLTASSTLAVPCGKC